MLRIFCGKFLKNSGGIFRNFRTMQSQFFSGKCSEIKNSVSKRIWGNAKTSKMERKPRAKLEKILSWNVLSNLKKQILTNYGNIRIYVWYWRNYLVWFNMFKSESFHDFIKNCSNILSTSRKSDHADYTVQHSPIVTVCRKNLIALLCSTVPALQDSFLQK